MAGKLKNLGVDATALVDAGAVHEGLSVAAGLQFAFEAESAKSAENDFIQPSTGLVVEGPQSGLSIPYPTYSMSGSLRWKERKESCPLPNFKGM
jgi:hypothetical protein